MGNSILFPAPPASYTRDLQHLEWIYLSGNPNHRIPCLFLRCRTPTSHNILYLHGNSCDLGTMRYELEVLAHATRCNILAVEYPGYGLCPGTPKASTIDMHARTAFDYLSNVLQLNSTSIVLMGRSIGTGPACKLARTLKEEGKCVGGIILHSPYISVHAIVRDYFRMGRLFVANHWDNNAALQCVAPDIPLLILHGEQDAVIPAYHSHCLYKSYDSLLKTCKFSMHGTHNEYDFQHDLINPVKRFLGQLSLSRYDAKRSFGYSSGEGTRGALVRSATVTEPSSQSRLHNGRVAHHQSHHHHQYHQHHQQQLHHSLAPNHTHQRRRHTSEQSRRTVMHRSTIDGTGMNFSVPPNFVRPLPVHPSPQPSLVPPAPAQCPASQLQPAFHSPPPPLLLPFNSGVSTNRRQSTAFTPRKIENAVGTWGNGGVASNGSGYPGVPHMMMSATANGLERNAYSFTATSTTTPSASPPTPFTATPRGSYVTPPRPSFVPQVYGLERKAQQASGAPAPEVPITDAATGLLSSMCMIPLPNSSIHDAIPATLAPSILMPPLPPVPPPPIAVPMRT